MTDVQQASRGLDGLSSQSSAAVCQLTAVRGGVFLCSGCKALFVRLELGCLYGQIRLQRRPHADSSINSILDCRLPHQKCSSAFGHVLQSGEEVSQLQALSINSAANWCSYFKHGHRVEGETEFVHKSVLQMGTPTASICQPRFLLSSQEHTRCSVWTGKALSQASMLKQGLGCCEATLRHMEMMRTFAWSMHSVQLHQKHG